MADDKNIGAIHMVNLSAYTTPVVEEKFNKEWVEYRVKGDDNYDYANGFYHYLIDRSKGSTTNGAVIKGFKRFIYGKGLSATNASRNVEMYADMKVLLKDRDLKKFIADRKILMMGALLITYGSGKVVSSITHWPMRTLLPEKMSKDGDIEAWHYHPNWSKKTASEIPKRIPAFGFGGTSPKEEIYIVKDYTCGSDYFSEDEGYMGALAYAYLEEVIGDFQINDAINGFTPSTIINYNNGVPEAEKRKKTAKETVDKVTGATGKKVIVSFNANQEAATTVEKIEMDQAAEHYKYLSEECENKILKGHQAPKELLGANSGDGGFANNAEELINKMRAFSNYVVKPFQIEIIEALDEILALNDIVLNLYFKPIDPLEFIDTENMDETTEEEETGQPEEVEPTELSAANSDYLINLGEDIDDSWEIIDDVRCDEITIKELQLNTVIELAQSPKTSRKKSKQDTTLFKIRYRYAGENEGEREFCRKVLAANKFYRAEDLNANFNYNEDFAPEGETTYNIFNFKGGVNCKHWWQRVIFLKKDNKRLSVNQARKLIASLDPKDRKDAKWVDNPKEVAEPAQKKNNWWSLRPNYRDSGVTPNKK